MAHRYRPGRDDPALDSLYRQMAAEWAALSFGPDLEAAADLNGRYEGRWHIWFVAQGFESIEWLARRVPGDRQPQLSAPSPEELVAKIEEEEHR